MGSYADGKFGVITRKFFGLTVKHGGETAAGFTFGTTDATKRVHVTRWRPRGPIKLLKAGILRLATFTHASSDLVPVRFRVRGASASLACTLYAKQTATAVAANTIASTPTLAYRNIKAGEYLTIDSGTPRTDKGTAANTATCLGTAAFFVDYVPTFDSDNKWEVTV